MIYRLTLVAIADPILQVTVVVVLLAVVLGDQLWMSGAGLNSKQPTLGATGVLISGEAVDRRKMLE